MCHHPAEPGAQRTTTSPSWSLPALPTSHFRMHIKSRHVTRILHISSLHSSSLRHLLCDSKLFTGWDHVVTAFPATGSPGILPRQLRSHRTTSVHSMVYTLPGCAIMYGRKRRIWKFRASILDARIRFTDLEKTRARNFSA